MSIRNHAFTSDGWNIIDRSLMRSSRSESKNSRTKFRLFFDGYISINLPHQSEPGNTNSAGFQYLCDILVMKFLHVLDFADGRHVHSFCKLGGREGRETVFEAAYSDGFYGDASVCARLSAEVDDGICSLSDLVLLCVLVLRP